MRIRTLLGLACILSASVAFADEVPWQWDNYLTAGAGYDGVTATSSEFYTRAEDSWTGDDMIVDQTVDVTSISWIGALEREPGATFDSVEVIIFRDPGSMPADKDLVLGTYAVDSPLIIGAGGSGDLTMTDRAGEYLYGLQIYDGTATFDDAIRLTPGHYYYAVRVRGNGLGRAYVASTGNGATNAHPGDSMGVFQSSTFDYPDPPGMEDPWVYVDSLPNSNASDYAYRINGIVVPEPAGFLLLAFGVLVARRMR